MVVGLGIALASCGEGGGGPGASGPGASGLEKSRTWSSLTTAEKGTLCDWVAARFGGYGMTMDCGNGTGIASNSSQQACIDALPATCGATVDAYEQCATDATCETGPFPPSCAPLLACFK
jgi:hypothetical protein